MTEAFIYDAVRTPRSRGRAGEALAGTRPVRLAAGLLDGMRARHDLDTALVEDVILGCVSPVADQGACVAKAAVQEAGWSESIPGFQLDRFCASGLEAVNIAMAKVKSDQHELIVAGGVESMSRVPLGTGGGAMYADPDFIADQKAVPQGIGADMIATLDGYSRDDVDGYALESQRRAAEARDSGWFDRSVLPVRDEIGQTVLDKDSYIRPGTDMQSLGSLPASFEGMGAAGFDVMAQARYPQIERIDHVHTAGNSSGIVDGASAVLIGSEAAGRSLGMDPRGRIVATAILSSDPVIMLAGPGPAAMKCLEKAGLTVADIDLWEINEAFASVALRYMRDLGIPHEITNVNGGAIAMGHPLGATGGMLISTVLDELERRGAKRGMISLCAGGGMGISTLIERL